MTDRTPGPRGLYAAEVLEALRGMMREILDSAPPWPDGRAVASAVLMACEAALAPPAAAPEPSPLEEPPW